MTTNGASAEASPKAAATVIRGAEVALLRAGLEEHASGLRIIGISGPGGVGKSYLLRHVLDAAEADGARWLKLSVDGSNEQARGDFFALVDAQLAKANLPPPAQPRRDYFPHVRKVAAVHRALVETVAAELDTGSAPAELKLAALGLLRMGRRLNKVVPKSKEIFDAGATEDAAVGPSIDDAWRLVTNLRALRSSSSLPGPLRELLGAGMKARVKDDLYNVTAEALVTDLEAALAGEGRRRHVARPFGGATRVLIVIDDYEALAPALEEFLVGALVPQLAEAPFPVTMVILGRDELEATHPAWSQHCRQYLAEPIRLAPFGRQAAFEMLAQAKVPEERRADMFEATQGFPFLLSLLVDELHADGADSALFLRKFFDRTTRWMSEREREWFVRVCYLDAVNVDTLAPLFPGERVEAIQDWFEREASIRDPAAPVFRVRPLIREKVLRYLELRSPSRHREMLEKARTAAPSEL